MPYTRRPYTGLDDLRKIQDLLRAGLLQSPHSGYVHPGDIEWWLFYNPWGDDPRDFVQLWVTPADDLMAFVVLTAQRRETNLFWHPQADSAIAEDMLLYSESVLKDADSERTDFSVEEVFADDAVQVPLLEKHGYIREQHLLYLTQDLTVDLPSPQLPEGFSFLDAMQPKFAEKRATVHASAFHPSRMTPERYQHFMTAPSYDPTLDVVVVAPDSQFVSFAMTWADEITRVAEFEPVGTYADWQRRGLGKAAVREGLRRLQARGMKTATVCTDADDAGNVAFYKSCGFSVVNELLKFKKPMHEGQIIIENEIK